MLPNRRPSMPGQSPATTPLLSAIFRFCPSSRAVAQILSISREMTNGGHRHTKNYKVNWGQSQVNSVRERIIFITFGVYLSY